MIKVLISILILGSGGGFGIGDFFGASKLADEPKVLGIEKIVGPERIEGESQGLKLSAKSAIVVDGESGQVLFEKEPDLHLPVASISKLVTVLTFLDTNPDWKKILVMQGSDNVGGAELKVGIGESLTVENLFYAGLIGSENNAITALVRSTGLSDREFMVLMNKKVRELGMTETYLAEPTGLNMVNHSTARDIAKLLKEALKHEKIVEALGKRGYSFQTLNTKRTVTTRNTDKLLASFLNDGDGYKVLGGKTGYTLEAGQCLALGVRGPEGQGIIGVILGAESNGARFQEMKGMIWWVFENWAWR